MTLKVLEIYSYCTYKCLCVKKPSVYADGVTYINKMAGCAPGFQALTAFATFCKSSEMISFPCGKYLQRVLLPWPAPRASLVHVPLQ